MLLELELDVLNAKHRHVAVGHRHVLAVRQDGLVVVEVVQRQRVAVQQRVVLRYKPV